MSLSSKSSSIHLKNFLNNMREYLFLIFVLWTLLGLIIAAVSVSFDWYRGTSFSLGDLVLFGALCTALGPFGIIMFIITQFGDRTVIKGRKREK